MSRVQLARIKSLTFYKDTFTAARRTDPLPQLTCLGEPCQLYTPDVVRCVNIGGEGTEVDWRVRNSIHELCSRRFTSYSVRRICRRLYASGESKYHVKAGLAPEIPMFLKVCLGV